MQPDLGTKVSCLSGIGWCNRHPVVTFAGLNPCLPSQNPVADFHICDIIVVNISKDWRYASNGHEYMPLLRYREGSC